MVKSIDRIRIIISVEDDAEYIDYAIRQLQRELNELRGDVTEALPQGSQIEPGAKSIDPATINALILSITPIAISKVLEFLYSWITRKDGRAVKIKIQRPRGDIIEVEIPASMSQDELKRLVRTVEDSISKRQGRSK